MEQYIWQEVGGWHSHVKTESDHTHGGRDVRYPFALRAERNGTNASDVRYPDAADPLYLLYLWTLGRRFLHSHLSPAYPVIPSWTHVMTFLQPRFVVIGTWHVYKPSYISPQSLVK